MGDVHHRHEIPIADGEAVVATHHEESGDRWIVFCHGFLSDRSGSYAGRCRRAVEEGYDAVRFDFRGCGDADGAFVEQTLSEKLTDLQHVVDHFDPDSYILVGSSFGGKVAFHAASVDDRVSAVATRAPVTYNRAFEQYRRTVEREGTVVFDDGRRIDERFFADFEDYPFASVVAEFDVPAALVHGGADETIPPEHSFEAGRALQTDVCVESFADEGHRFTERGERRFRNRLFDWFKSLPG